MSCDHAYSAAMTSLSHAMQNVREWSQSILRPYGRDAALAPLPKRVDALIRAQEIDSERLIGWVQLVMVLLFGALYLIAPRPADAPMAVLAPVPIALLLYAGFTLARLRLAYRRPLPGWLLGLSILADTALLLGLIWTFHGQYSQPLAFSLKVPTFIYFIVFIALRTLRFDFRYVVTAGLAAALGWTLLVIFAIQRSPAGTVTRNFTSYVTGNSILVGAEFDKIFAMLMATAILALAVGRARRTLVAAVRAEAAGREIRRFLSSGVADVIARSDTVVEAGQAAERDAAVLMLDIRGFTAFSKTVTPAVVVEMLTKFHARILPLIRAHGGVIDKFLGDGVMATFGAVAPSGTAAADALRALDAIMGAAELCRDPRADPGAPASLEINGAVAAGRVVFAALGYDDRLEYTVIGDAANLAAKLEKHNKAEGTRALVAGATFDLAVAQGYVPVQRPEWRRSVQIAGTSGLTDIVVQSN